MKNIAFLMFLCGAAPSLFAANDTITEDDTGSSKIEFIKTSHHPDVKELLKKDRPQDVNAIQVPHFAIRTADNKFVMTLGVQLNPIIGCDLGNDLYEIDGAGIGFVTGMIPVPSVRGRRSDFFINPLGSCVDFQVVGFGGTDNQVSGYIKFGTNGEDAHVKLKKAYVSWRGLTAGMKHTLFEDEVASQPATIDPQGPCGMVSGTAYEISYVSKPMKGFRFGLGVAMPSYYSASGRYLGHDFKYWKGEEIDGQPVADPTAYNQIVPDVPMFVEWGKSEFNRIRVSGIVRNFSYRDLLEGKRRSSVGWGLMLSGNLNPVEPLIFYLTACYGKGIGAYIQDLAGQPLSFIPDDARPGHMTPSPMMGLMLGATYNFNSRWQVNAMVSDAAIWKVEEYARAAATALDNINNYRSGFYAAGNVFYNISSYLQVGLEYVYGHRRTWGAGSASDSRLQMQFMFSL